MRLRRWLTGERDQVGFHTAIDFAPQGSLFGVVAAQGRRQALLHKPLFDANDGAGTDLQSSGDLAAGKLLLVAFISFEQHASSHLLMRGRFAGMNQVMQFLPLLFAEMDRIAFLAHAGFLLLAFSLNIASFLLSVNFSLVDY